MIGESTSMVWLTVGSRTTKEQNRTEDRMSSTEPEVRDPYRNGTRVRRSGDDVLRPGARWNAVRNREVRRNCMHRHAHAFDSCAPCRQNVSELTRLVTSWT